MKSTPELNTSLKTLFSPRAIAVIGASRDPKAIGHKIVRALVEDGFRGKIYPVNPNLAGHEIEGLACYPSAANLPDGVDLAVVVVPAERVLEVVDQCHGRKIPSIVVISAGFAETGEKGRALQNELVMKVRAYGMRMVGPNCFGVINTSPSVSMNASWAPLFPIAGSVAMASQSGALGLEVLGLSHQYHLGFSEFVSMGNKGDISSNDLIQHWEQDPSTSTILLYLESFGHPARFELLASRVGRKKPIVAVKSGRSVAGGRAAGSHTAALANNDTAVEALFHQAGVIRAETVEEMFDLATALSYQPLPRGRRVGIVTNAGGPAILCTDACEAADLVVPELSPQLKARLREKLPSSASPNNPVDMIASASPEHYRDTIEILLSSGEIDALIVLYILLEKDVPPDLLDGIRQGIQAGRQKGAVDVPIFFGQMAPGSSREPLKVGKESVPVYQFPEKPARVLSRICGYAEWRRQPPAGFVEFPDLNAEAARRICQTAIASRGETWLTADETRELLTVAALPLPRSAIARTPEEAVTKSREIGFPVALKLASHTLVHKTEVGGVQLDLPDEKAVRDAFSRISENLRKLGFLDQMEGVLVQPMLSGGTEIMVGMTRDPLFGPMVAFGLGGIFVEILSDVSFRLAPLNDRDANEMIHGIKGYRLLKGYRGHPEADEQAIARLILQVGQLAESVPEITSLDLNPVFALTPGKGCVIADARIGVKGQEK